MRSLMNLALMDHTLEKGVVVDLGGGKNPSYLDFFQSAADSMLVNIDMQHAGGNAGTIDFEKDTLPYLTASVDQVLMLNILEHIYNHQFFIGESFRILKKGKRIVGFVPFLINYHADPHDYFRYTHEALERMFTETGFTQVKIDPVGLGPFAVNFNMLASFMPSIFNAVVWPVYYGLDRLVLAMRPGMRQRFPLGYMFVLTK